MKPTTINQRAAILLNEHLVFENQTFITWKFKGKGKPKSEQEHHRKINSHLVWVARQMKAHIFPIVGVNPIGHEGQDNLHYHSHGLILSDKPIPPETLSSTWQHGNVVCFKFEPREYLTKYASDALSYIMEKHDYRPMTIICPRHNRRACGKVCCWKNRTLMKESIAATDAELLRMILNLW